MSSHESPPDPLPITAYIEDGARIAGILLVWGVLSLFATYLLGNVGTSGSLFGMFGPWLGEILMQIGLLNAIVYVIYRGIDYWKI